MPDQWGLGTYTEAVGNIGEGWVFNVAREMALEERSPTALVLGGSLYLCADFLHAGWKLIFVYSGEVALEPMYTALKGLTADECLVDRQFRTECRDFREDVSDLAAGVSVAVMTGLAHHVADPAALLSGFLRSNKPAVVLDTTVELMEELIVEDGRLHRTVCDEHFVCRDSAKWAGFHTVDDIERLLAGPRIRPAKFFQYRLQCCWCDSDERGDCTHRGHTCWLASWGGA